MSVERPRRNAKKHPDPDFFVDLPPSFSPTPTRGPKRRSSIDEGLEFLDELMIAIPEALPKKSLKKPLVKSPKTRLSPQRSPTTVPKSPTPLKSPPRSPKLISPKSPLKKNAKILAVKNIRVTPRKIPPQVVAKTSPKNVANKVAPKSKPSPQKKVAEPIKCKIVSPKKSPPSKITTPVKLEPPMFRSKVPLKSEVSPTKRRILKSTATTPKCRVSCCTSKNTSCFVNNEGCCGSGQSSRWYHISSSEHYCNQCFEYFYRSNKPGNNQYTKWRKKWASNSQYDPTSPLFMSDQILPYWLQCQKCRKWRQVPRTTYVNFDVIKQFVCGQHVERVQCSDPEDERVKDVLDLNWITSFTVMPYLDRSPAAAYLQNYYPDGCGMSAHILQTKPSNNDALSKDSRDGFDSESSISTSSSSSEESVLSVRPLKTSSVKPGAMNIESSTQIEFFQPFHQPEEAFRAYCVPPDSMLEFEIESFSEFAHNQQIYLGLRNLVMTLWCLNYKEWLTVEKCVPYVICRGLGRIRVIQELGRIIDFLTRRGYINQGILMPPKHIKMHDISKQDQVIVVGAGPAGLAAARQLHRFGVPVTVLEARNRIGGRVWDNHEMSARVGHGAMIVVGHINNPITLLCHQLGLRTRRILDHCDLFTIEGQLTETNLDHRIEVHFNSILDAIAEWRRNRSQDDDSDLLTRILATHKEILRENNMPEFTEEENLLLQFHISNLEYACGCQLSRVSALQWDQNEVYPQFMGQHSMIKDGYSALLQKITDNLNIKLSTEATNIEYGEDGVKVTTKSGEVIEGSKVIVTLPLALLQQDVVPFDPPLPKSKLDAIHHLGAGNIEKVVLEFPERFWDDKLQGADFFGLVPPSENERGLFGVFYDITPREERSEASGHVLMTWVSGSAIKLIKDKSDQQVIDMCMSALKRVFADKEVCEPQRWFVTRWGEDPFSRMSYSYVPVGSTGQMYANMAEEVDNTVFFAGEATNRQFPQTVTGAYLSGLREADKILKTLRPSFTRHALIRVNEVVPGKRGRKASFMKAVQLPEETPPSLTKKKGAQSPKKEVNGLPEQKNKARTSTAWVRAPKGKGPPTTSQVSKKPNNGVVAETSVSERSAVGKKRSATGGTSPLENGVSLVKRGRPLASAKGNAKPKPSIKPLKIAKVSPPVLLKQRDGQDVRRSRRIRLSLGEDVKQEPVAMETNAQKKLASPEVKAKRRSPMSSERKCVVTSAKGRAMAVTGKACVKIEGHNQNVETEDMEILEIVKIEDLTNDVKTGAQNDNSIKANIKDVQKPVLTKSPKKSPSPAKTGGNILQRTPEKNYPGNGISMTIIEGGDNDRKSLSPGSPGKRGGIKIKLRIGKVVEPSHMNRVSGSLSPTEAKSKSQSREGACVDDISRNLTRVYEVLAVETGDMPDVAVDTSPSTSSSNGMLSPRTPPRARLSPQVAELSDHDYF